MIPLQSIKNIAFPTKTKEKRMRNSLHSSLYPLFCQKVYHFKFINTRKEKNRPKRNPKCRAGMSHGPLSYIAFVSLYLFLCILIGSGDGGCCPFLFLPGALHSVLFYPLRCGVYIFCPPSRLTQRVGSYEWLTDRRAPDTGGNGLLRVVKVSSGCAVVT